MATACINKPNCRISLTGERLEIHGRNEESDRDECLREIPLRDLDRLILSESVHISSPALGEILRRGIPIGYFSWKGRFLGQFLPADNHHGFSRLIQYQRTLDSDYALTMAGRLIAAKLYNQRRVLQRIQASRVKSLPNDEVLPPVAGSVPHTLQFLDSLFASIRRSTSLDELRGYEGTSAARYFQAWASFLPAAFPFERRSTRPPRNPVNACISFGATLITNEMTAFLHAHGLDPALGLLHTTENGRWSLALDLIEPFRPALVEALALDLFSHQIVKANHFESRDNGVFLNHDGRQKFFLQYERRMERQFMSESAGHRTTLRQQLEAQALMFKAALSKPDAFEPFLIN
jgi:CRISPR-associated protein Cas1